MSMLRRYTWSLIAALALASAAACTVADGDEPYWDDLLAHPDRADEALVVIADGPVGPSTPQDPEDDAAGDDEFPDRWFHEEGSRWWYGAHIGGSTENASKYRDGATGDKYEHITDRDYSPHASLYKPDGTFHIKEGEHASKYDKALEPVPVEPVPVE